jgi:hypothetical protein
MLAHIALSLQKAGQISLDGVLHHQTQHMLCIHVRPLERHDKRTHVVGQNPNLIHRIQNVVPLARRNANPFDGIQTLVFDEHGLVDTSECTLPDHALYVKLF